MSIDLVFKIAAIGILVTVLSQLLTRAGRDDIAMLTTLTGLIIVLFMVVNPVSYTHLAEEFPQAGISLRSASDQNFLIIDITDPKHHRVDVYKRQLASLGSRKLQCLSCYFKTLHTICQTGRFPFFKVPACA